jgi:hypothetical protein
MRKSTVLSFPPQLVFPGYSGYLRTNLTMNRVNGLLDLDDPLLSIHQIFSGQGDGILSKER